MAIWKQKRAEEVRNKGSMKLMEVIKRIMSICLNKKMRNDEFKRRETKKVCLNKVWSDCWILLRVFNISKNWCLMFMTPIILFTNQILYLLIFTSPINQPSKQLSQVSFKPFTNINQTFNYSIFLICQSPIIQEWNTQNFLILFYLTLLKSKNYVNKFQKVWSNIHYFLLALMVMLSMTNGSISSELTIYSWRP